MKYYKLKPIANKPFISISLIANSLDELTSKGLTVDSLNKDKNLTYDPLIVDENNLPSYKEGVCLKSVVGGVIADTPSNKLPPLSDAILNNEIVSIDEQTKTEIAKGFSFDGNQFSLSKSAQINWLSYYILNKNGVFTDTDVSTIDNKVYKLTSAKVDSFYLASRNKIESVLSQGRTFKNNLTII